MELGKTKGKKKMPTFFLAGGKQCKVEKNQFCFQYEGKKASHILTTTQKY